MMHVVKFQGLTLSRIRIVPEHVQQYFRTDVHIPIPLNFFVCVLEFSANDLFNLMIGISEGSDLRVLCDKAVKIVNAF